MGTWTSLAFSKSPATQLDPRECHVLAPTFPEYSHLTSILNASHKFFLPSPSPRQHFFPYHSLDKPHLPHQITNQYEKAGSVLLPSLILLSLQWDHFFQFSFDWCLSVSLHKCGCAVKGIAPSKSFPSPLHASMSWAWEKSSNSFNIEWVF